MPIGGRSFLACGVMTARAGMRYYSVESGGWGCVLQFFESLFSSWGRGTLGREGQAPRARGYAREHAREHAMYHFRPLSSARLPGCPMMRPGVSIIPEESVWRKDKCIWDPKHDRGSSIPRDLCTYITPWTPTIECRALDDEKSPSTLTP